MSSVSCTPRCTAPLPQPDSQGTPAPSPGHNPHTSQTAHVYPHQGPRSADSHTPGRYPARQSPPVSPPPSGQLPAATPQPHYRPTRTPPRGHRQVSPCRTRTLQPRALSPCQPRRRPPHIATSSSAVGIRRPSGLTDQHARHTPPGNTASLSVGVAHFAQSIMSCPFLSSSRPALASPTLRPLPSEDERHPSILVPRKHQVTPPH